jgi:small subunit ribosomal protein S27Ae
MSKKVAKKEAPPEETKVEEKKAEAAPQKVEKTGKREKKRRKEKGVHAMYKVENEKVTRLRPTCERCGPGYFMGDHVDRYTCGHCGFTRYKRSEK